MILTVTTPRARNAKPIGVVSDHLVPDGVVAILKALRWVLQTLTYSSPVEFEENLRNCYEMIPKAFQSRGREKCHLNGQSGKEAEVPML